MQDSLVIKLDQYRFVAILKSTALVKHENCQVPVFAGQTPSLFCWLKTSGQKV